MGYEQQEMNTPRPKKVALGAMISSLALGSTVLLGAESAHAPIPATDTISTTASQASSAVGLPQVPTQTAALTKPEVIAPAIIPTAPPGEAAVPQAEGMSANVDPAAPLTIEPPLPPPPPPVDPALYQAVKDGNLETLEKLLKDGVSPNGVSPEGDTALCAAIRLKKPDLAAKLLEAKADPNAPGLDGQYPIVLVSLRRHATLMDDILAAGADPNQKLVSPPSQELVDLMTDERFAREMKSELNLTPLMMCSARGDVEAVASLMKHGAKSNAFTRPNSRYALNYAGNRGYLYVMRLLLGRHPESEPQFLITVNLSTQRVKVEKEGKNVLSSSISTGRKGYETPNGRYVITNKYKNWTSTIYKVPMPYFMRLNCSAIGLHSGYVSGRPASHGCIRLPPAVAKKLFSIANVGDEVIIEH